MAATIFAPGAEVEVRSRFTQAAFFSGSGAKTMTPVIYARATVVSVSAGAAYYLVRYPAAGSLLPSRVKRVPASDVRKPRRRPLLAPAPSTANSGRGIPMDALLRFFEEHERQEVAKEKKKQKQKVQHHQASAQQVAPVFVSISSPSPR